MPSQPAQIRSRSNKRLRCGVQGCPRSRNWTSQFCSVHRRRSNLHGHPLGRHLQRREYEPYRRAIHVLFTKYKQHPALTAADELMAVILSPGQEPHQRNHYDARYFRWRELSRIKDVSSRTALETAAAIWCLVSEKPRVLPNDCDRQLARAVLRLREFSGYVVWDHRKGKSRKRVHTPGSLVVAPLGREIRETLGMFFGQVAKALDAEKDERNTRAVIPATYPVE